MRIEKLQIHRDTSGQLLLKNDRPVSHHFLAGVLVVQSFTPLRAAKKWLIWTIWFGVPAWFAWSVNASEPQISWRDSGNPASETFSTPKVPLWQQGVAQWNGTGYSHPSPSLAATNSVANPVSHAEDGMHAQTGLNIEQVSHSSSVVPTTPNPVTPPYTVPFDPSMQAIGISYPAATIAANLTPPSLSGPITTPSAQPSPAFSTANSASTPTFAEPVTDFEMLGEEPSEFWSPSAPIGQGLATPPSENTLPLATSAPEEMNTIDSHSMTIEEPPLEQEVLRWYQYPVQWMHGWDSHAEFGLDGSSGNAETLALQMGLEMKRQTDDYTFAIDVDYRNATSRRVTTEDNGRFNVDYDRMLSDSKWSLFAKYGMEWDKFKAFDLRLNINGGAGYHWIRTDDTTLVTRFGAGASREIGAPIDEWTPEAVFGAEASRQLTSRQKLKAKIDYFPAWEDFSDYRLVSDFSWEILLDGSENLSLKLAATDRYDSTPQGALANDVYYSLLLLYKF
ncbi:hypothetical protein CA13_33240 [Planctomycetes bacterium CA13]|uniref:Chromo domain-containing protein n=1 Tax=Novipirellula herctigrandis TaxID=2527986 RepID=A0A5C5Z3A5_9BACT|nr:hypothetical protein CA13_33240 [Planctomycetes bacterium CA13]